MAGLGRQVGAPPEQAPGYQPSGFEPAGGPGGAGGTGVGDALSLRLAEVHPEHRRVVDPALADLPGRGHRPVRGGRHRRGRSSAAADVGFRFNFLGIGLGLVGGIVQGVLLVVVAKAAVMATNGQKVDIGAAFKLTSNNIVAGAIFGLIYGLANSFCFLIGIGVWMPSASSR